ncbi:MAG TPA: hypothetical protein VF176_08440 [Solirubrobacterales bacterium]
MARGLSNPPVLAEIAAPPADEARTWRLRRSDYEMLGSLIGAVREARVVLVTGEGEGKSAAAIGLATVAAATGRRTALLECDLCRPGLATSLGLTRAPGLHEYLRCEASAPEILQPLVLAGPASNGAVAPLICIVAGAATADAAPLLASDDFAHATSKLRNAYDLLVVDGPPMAGGDGALAGLASKVDATLACVPRSRLRRGKPTKRLRQELRRLPTPATGLVVFD